MATQFAKQFKRTAARSLLHQFGESIVYYRSGLGYGDDIQARVIRDPLQIMEEIGDVLVTSLIVSVLDDDLLGVAATSIDTGRDRVFISTVTDGDKTMRSVVRVLSAANGQVRFLVQ